MGKIGTPLNNQSVSGVSIFFKHHLTFFKEGSK
jgi:hypothetical protein